MAEYQTSPYQQENARFMEQAIALALENIRAGLGGPFGAVIVKNGQVIAAGCNRVTSSNDPTSHAEVMAIRAACAALNAYQLEGCDLYTTCEPCPMCFGAIYWAHIQHVYYGCVAADAANGGFSDQHIYTEIARPVDGRSVPFTPLMREQALACFREWNRIEDRVVY